MMRQKPIEIIRKPIENQQKPNRKPIETNKQLRNKWEKGEASGLFLNQQTKEQNNIKGTNKKLRKTNKQTHICEMGECQRAY